MSKVSLTHQGKLLLSREECLKLEEGDMIRFSVSYSLKKQYYPCCAEVRIIKAEGVASSFSLKGTDFTVYYDPVSTGVLPVEKMNFSAPTWGDLDKRLDEELFKPVEDYFNRLAEVEVSKPADREVIIS